MKKLMRKFFINPIEGIIISTREEISILYLMLFQGALIGTTIYLDKITNTELIIVVLVGVLSLIVELINSSVEATVDIATKEKMHLAKKAKDSVAGAQFVTSSFSLALFIYLNFIR